MYGIFSKNGAIHNHYEKLVAKVFPIEFPTILDRFFTSVVSTMSPQKGVEDGGDGAGKR